MPIFQSIRDFFHFTRAYQWYPGKIPLMLGFVLTMLLSVPGSQHGFIWVLAAYILTILYLAAAYMINNIADKEQDRIANKKIGLEDWSQRKRAIPVIIFSALCLGGGILLLPVLAVFAMIGCYILAWCYSFPPRFKEHALWGPILCPIAQIPAPALVVAVAWGTLPMPALIYLLIVYFYFLRMLLVHHLLDYENDRITGTYTTAIALGVPATKRLVQLTFVLEMFCTILFLILVVCAGLPKILLISLVWPLFLVILRWIRREPVQLDSYSYIPLADVHESLIPLILAIGIAMNEGGSMIAIVPFVVFLFLNRHFDRLVRPLFNWK